MQHTTTPYILLDTARGMVLDFREIGSFSLDDACHAPRTAVTNLTLQGRSQDTSGDPAVRGTTSLA